jgi:inward rectifier potassium channel
MLLDLEAKILLVMVVEENGTHVRKFYDLPLEMSKINMLAMSWTLVHPIDESSPIYSLDIEKLKNARSEFMVLIKGYNDTMSQAIHSRTSYKPDEIEWGARFSPIFTNSNGITGVAIDQISNFERVNLQ